MKFFSNIKKHLALAILLVGFSFIFRMCGREIKTNQNKIKQSQNLLDLKNYQEIINQYKNHEDLGPLLESLQQNAPSKNNFILLGSEEETKSYRESFLCKKDYSKEIDLLIESFIGLSQIGFTLLDIYEAILNSKSSALDDIAINLTISDYSEMSEKEILNAINLIRNYSTICQSEEYFDREIVLRLSYLLFLGKYIYGDKKMEYEAQYRELTAEINALVLNEKQKRLYSSEFKTLKSNNANLETMDNSLEHLTNIASKNNDKEFLELLKSLKEKANDLLETLKEDLHRVNIIFQQALTTFFLTGTSDNKLLTKLKEKFDKIKEMKKIEVTIGGKEHTFDWTTGYSETTDQILGTYSERETTDQLREKFKKDFLLGLQNNLDSRKVLIGYKRAYAALTSSLKNTLKKSK